MPREVDGPLRAFGMPMGPLQMGDLAGLDIGAFIRKELDAKAAAAAAGARYFAGLADKLVAGGRLGQKTRRGWYDYSAGRAPVDDPAVEALIAQHSAECGRVRRHSDGDEVLDRCLLPLVNEGFRVLGEGVAQRESDLDVVFI